MSAVGYSGTPLPKKLGIKPGHRVMLLGAPADFDLGELEGRVSIVRSARGLADVIVSFHTRRSEFERRLPRLQAAMLQNAGLWIAWPKRASKVPTDMNEHVVRGLALQGTLVDNKIAAISEVWSGMRLVIRREHRLP